MPGIFSTPKIPSIPTPPVSMKPSNEVSAQLRALSQRQGQAAAVLTPIKNQTNQRAGGNSALTKTLTGM